MMPMKGRENPSGAALTQVMFQFRVIVFPDGGAGVVYGAYEAVRVDDEETELLDERDVDTDVVLGDTVDELEVIVLVELELTVLDELELTVEELEVDVPLELPLLVDDVPTDEELLVELGVGGDDDVESTGGGGGKAPGGARPKTLLLDDV